MNRPNCSDTDHVFAYKWSVPKYMFRDDTFPNALSGSGYLMSQTVTSCLYNKGLDTSFLVLEDIFITGVVREKCGLQLKHSPRFQVLRSTQHLSKGTSDLKQKMTQFSSTVVHEHAKAKVVLFS